MTGPKALLNQLERLLNFHEEKLTPSQFLQILSVFVRQEMNLRLEKTTLRDRKEDPRRVCYFSAEFLTGRLLHQNLLSLGIKEEVSRLAAQHDLELTEILEEELDPGLGNGGLGRLASCFMDSLVHMDLPATGYGICYRFGLFNQTIEDQRQNEHSNPWRERDLWGTTDRNKCYRIPFGGTVDFCGDEEELKFALKPAYEILARPVDYPVSSTVTTRVQPLRLWKSESPYGFDLKSFNNGKHSEAWHSINEAESLTAVLYPGDESDAGKKLRLKQQFFFVSASLQDLMAVHRSKHPNDWNSFPDRIVIQLNDTHPVLAIPELMRLLLDEEDLTWDESWNICTRIFAYTNHTVLEEALEKWPIPYMKELFPRHLLIIEEIQRRLEEQPGTPSVIRDGMLHMASLAVHGSFSVNGVAALHSRLLKETVLRDWYACCPEKFNNKTNGITHRRWLMQCNPGLTDLINRLIGTQWQKNPLQLEELGKYRNDSGVLEELDSIKRENKRDFSRWIKKQQDLVIPDDFIFDFQVKRIHEYKRQLLNIFSILLKYKKIRNGLDSSSIPHIYFIGGKAAPSYYIAKEIIHLACRSASIINADPLCRDKMQLHFLPGYNVSMAERIFPGAELSQQISTAGKEASGTGNMKFMMNGSLTLGTRDGANIEIFQSAGEENNIPFGMNTEEVVQYKKDYNPLRFLKQNRELASLIEDIEGGLLGDADEFSNLLNHLTKDDPYLVLPEVAAHTEALKKAEELYSNRREWNTRSLMNIASSGVFSSDRTISEYASEIWKISARKTF